MTDAPAVYVDAMMASVHLLLAHGLRVSPEQIRQWGQRDKLSRLPTGRYRYNLLEVEEFVLRRADDGRAGT